jgi:RNA polymerase sigma factor (sigma-70 family)
MCDPFRTFHDAYQGYLLALFQRWVSDAKVEDLAQTTWLKVYAARVHEMPKDDVKKMMWRIAQNVAIDDWRSHARSPLVDAPVGEDETWNPAAPERPCPVEDQEHRARVHQVVVKAIRALVPEQQVTVFLRYYAGLENKRIAELTGVSVDAVESRLRRARKELEPLLESLNPNSRQN